jgi:hypothetical protein
MNRQLRQTVVLAASLVAVAAIQVTVLVALEDQEAQEAQAAKAVWSAEETTALIDYLYEHRPQAGNGGNFKTASFTAAAEAISPLLKYGPEKTGKICRRKWSSVSGFLCAFCSPYRSIYLDQVCIFQHP